MPQEAIDQEGEQLPLFQMSSLFSIHHMPTAILFHRSTKGIFILGLGRNEVMFAYSHLEMEKPELGSKTFMLWMH